MQRNVTVMAEHTTPELRQLGRSGLTVSVVGLGCNNLGANDVFTADLAGTKTVIDTAIDAGITFFDTADNYGAEPGASETLLGQALGSRRDSVVVATKFGMDITRGQRPDEARGSRNYIIRAVEASLRRLGTDYIDLYQFHTPDPHTPIDETLRALDALVTSGKVRYLGHSNRAGWQIAQAEYVARELGAERFVSCQNHYNLLDRRAELEVLPAAREFGLGVLPYFPLANGLLTGKYRRGDAAPQGSRLSRRRQHMLAEAPWDSLDSFFTIASDLDLTPGQLAISWAAAQRPVASVIAGATSAEQVRQNAAAYRALTTDTLQQLDELFPSPPTIALF